MNHIMLDLETLGSGSRAAVVAIGAVAFDPAGSSTPADIPSSNRFYATITPDSAIEAGLEVTGSTIQWWMQQSDAARQQTFGLGAGYLVPTIVTFRNFVLDHGGKDAVVWGNGATFDNVIIRSAFAAAGQTPPWSFRNDRCYRTVCNLLPKAKQPELIRLGTFHNALDDAVTQALHLQKVYKLLGLS